MEEAFSNAAADRGGAGAAPGGGGGGGSGAGPDDDFAGGGIRLESIVRHHRRRCAVRTEALAAEQLSPPRGEDLSIRGGSYSVGSKRHAGAGVAEVEGRERAAAAAMMVSGEVEAMAAAAGRLADPVVVGRLFDSILPPIARFSPQQEADGYSSPSAAAATPEAEPRPTLGGASTGDDDPVLALCSLYADLVMDGVRAGSAAAAAAGGTTSANASSSSSAAAKMSVSPGKSVLNALAFGRPKAPIAARLWSYLQRQQDLRVYAKGGGRAGGRVQSALFLFCSACRCVREVRGDLLRGN